MYSCAVRKIKFNKYRFRTQLLGGNGMKKWQVSLNNDSFNRAGITKDCKDAVCEYIWNGFEAGASKVSVSLQGAP